MKIETIETAAVSPLSGKYEITGTLTPAEVKRLAKIDRMLDKNAAKLAGTIATGRRPSKLHQRLKQLADEKNNILTPDIFADAKLVTPVDEISFAKLFPKIRVQRPARPASIWKRIAEFFRRAFAKHRLPKRRG